MSCKTVWNDKYISNALLPAFFKTDYKTHTNKNSIEEQLALLPDTQPAVEAIIAKEKARNEYNANIKMQLDIYEYIDNYKRNKILDFIREIRTENNKKIDDKYHEELKKPRNERMKKSNITKMFNESKYDINIKATNRFNKYIETINEDNKKYIEDSNKVKELEKKEIELEKIIYKESIITKSIYNRPCSNSTCNGMLKTDSNLCSICYHITCSKCLQPYNKDIKDHKCNEDDIKTAKLIKHDTKYCPKCNFGITKISGCDVMFCTQCNTSFNWKTMEILTKNLHNPHYLEYLRKNGTQRERNNVVNNCTANPTITDFDTRRFSNIRNFCYDVQLFNPFKIIMNKGINVIQYILHISENATNIRTKINNYENSNREARINFLLNKIDRDAFNEIVSKNCYEIRILTQKEQIVLTAKDISTELIFNLSNNELMAINNSIFNILDSSTSNNSFSKISNKTEEFFRPYITIETFKKVMDKLDNIITEIKNIAQYCIKEDKELSKLYGRSVNYMLNLYLY
tara:strand:- start:2433 stop:3980 length:1548 start_codon:yes stop_codon:yes gene_type:complete